MKRITALIALVGLLFALTACGKGAEGTITLYEGNAVKIEREGAITRIYDLEGGGGIFLQDNPHQGEEGNGGHCKNRKHQHHHGHNKNKHRTRAYYRRNGGRGNPLY